MDDKILLPSATDNQPIMQLIVFRVADEEFAVPIEIVQEIIKVATITPIPGMPTFIKGLINVRGDVVPAIDVRERFSLPNSEEFSKHVIITKQDGNLFGLIVDEVTEVLRIRENEIKTTPQLITKVHKDYIYGVLTNDDRLIILLDVSKIITTELHNASAAIQKETKLSQSEVDVNEEIKGSASKT